ncbi:unnamed protein product [Acanthoscelides obtectus]|uniref:Uncharacterized protein n=1 Tax=Acanthoscelides obtectus TaxID=200917 RepID=A0A9P0PCP9_ACAOB|nr:unnamed protein product [Acanthoscelides obtectus]CAK1655185.1 RYamide neuropeptides [Acanthoscelides obtectus]
MEISVDCRKQFKLNNIKSFYRQVFIIVIGVGLLPGPSSFKTMLRFGRSSNSNSDKDLKPVNVYPRADAFFLGPRYGKRSVWGPNPLSMTCGEESDMSCSWVGLSNLYRCIQRKDMLISSN